MPRSRISRVLGFLGIAVAATACGEREPPPPPPLETQPPLVVHDTIVSPDTAEGDSVMVRDTLWEPR